MLVYEIPGAFKLAFQTIKQHISEFINIHLLVDVGWIAILIFESITELSRIKTLLVTSLQPNKKSLELIKNVVFSINFVELGIIRFENCQSQ